MGVFLKDIKGEHESCEQAMTAGYWKWLASCHRNLKLQGISRNDEARVQVLKVRRFGWMQDYSMISNPIGVRYLYKVLLHLDLERF